MNTLVFRGIVGALALVVSQAGTLFAEDKSETPDVREGVSKDVDPFGRPKQFIQGKRKMYGIWYEDGIWKLRTTSGRGVKIEFVGSVEVDRDRIYADYSALDLGKGKRRKDGDVVRIANRYRKMTYRFITIGLTDGIDFKIGPRAKKVTFNLRVAGDDDPRFILIGAKGAHPEKGVFTLPANPTKKDGNEAEKESDAN